MENTNLRWLQVLSVLMFFAGLSFLVARLHSAFVGRLPVYALSLTIYYIGLMGARQPFLYTRVQSSSLSTAKRDNIQAGHPLPPPVVSPIGEPVAASPTSKVEKTPKEDAQDWARLEKLIKNEKSYLEPSLTIAQLASRTQLTTKRLSGLISSFENCNFFDYINNHRIHQAKQLLTDPTRKWSITEIAVEAGFNSRSPFYAQFKKRTGMTPSEYRSSEKRP